MLFTCDLLSNFQKPYGPPCPIVHCTSTFVLKTVSSTDTQRKVDMQIQIQWQNFHFHLFISSPSTENWYMGPARQSTAHKSLEIWWIEVKTFTFLQPILSRHKLIGNRIDCVKIKGLLITSSLQPPPGSSNLVFTSFFPPAGLQDGVGQGRPPTWATSCPPISCTSFCRPSPLPSRSSCSSVWAP